MADPIFIGGLMKSGTTLLRALVSNHPNVFGGLETQWFSDDFMSEWQDPDAACVARVRAFYGVSVEDHYALRTNARDALDYLDGFMALCARRSEKRRWVEKTPGNATHLGDIFDRWSGAQFLHVIRDPRDVYASWKKNGKYDLGRFLSDVHHIERAVGDRLGSTDRSYTEVHYEDLVSDPESTMRAVFRFLGEPWVEGIDRYAGTDEDFRKVKAVTGEESSTLLSLSRPIFSDSTGQWRDTLSRHEQNAIEAGAHSYARRTAAFRE